MNSISKILVTIVLLLTYSISNAQISKVEIVATGLTCSMCSNAINKQLKSMPEVVSVDTDLNTSTFIVTLKSNNILTPKNFKDKVEKAGFFIGSLKVITKSDVLKNSNFVIVSGSKPTTSDVEIQILDNGYVTEKVFKKSLKTYKDIATFAVKNDADFHVKILK
jgi:copper chaperone CopZ